MIHIELRNLTKVFPRAAEDGRLTIYRDFNLEIEAGETLAIVGPSGCGKTTLLNTIALLEAHDSGEVLFGGEPKDVCDAGSLSVGYLFQRDALLPWRTAWGNAILGLSCRGMLNQNTKDLAATYFRRFGLEGFEHAWPQTLSGGQRQRVALIQNLLIDPDVLLLDEPFGSLDYQTKLVLEGELLSVIRSRNGNGSRKTVIFVTHDIEEAIVFADRVIVLGMPPVGIHYDARLVENASQVSLQEEHDGRVYYVFPESLRDPVSARQSSVMQTLFGNIWGQLQPRAQKADARDSTKPATLSGNQSHEAGERMVGRRN